MSVFEQEYRLRTSDYDRYGRVYPSSILDVFQDAAGEHAERLGMGFEAMLARGMAWVVLRTRYEIVRQPALYATVRVRTWPQLPGRLEFCRDYELCDTEGNLLARATSQWVVIRTDTRKLVPAGEVAFPEDACEERRLFPDRLRKLRDFQPEGEPVTVYSSFCDIDRNGHVNNARYAAYLSNALEPEREIRALQIDYHKEVLPHTALRLGWQREGTAVQCRGTDPTGALMFSAALELG